MTPWCGGANRCAPPGSRRWARRGKSAGKLVHILVGGMALLLRWLTWWQSALVAIAAVLFNLFLLPKIATGVFRPAISTRRSNPAS